MLGQNSGYPLQLTEYSLYVPLIRLLTNPTGALTSIHGKYGDLVLTRFFNIKFSSFASPNI
jgi:hypothetical protein